MPKDVTILTGFLGAGKTTLLNALMNARPHTRFALIENEFGKEGIDGDMVIRPDVDVVELDRSKARTRPPDCLTERSDAADLLGCDIASSDELLHDLDDELLLTVVE